jgi:hypothetical protein
MPDSLLINGTDSLLINGTDTLLINNTGTTSNGYGQFFTININSWREGDFSSDSKLSGTVYVDKAKTTPKDLTGLSVRIRIYNRS